MLLTILEIGSKSKTDTQHQVIDFNGTLDDYMEKSIKEIEADPNLKLEEALKTDNGSILIDFFCILMNKSIRHYAFAPLYVKDAFKVPETLK